MIIGIDARSITLPEIRGPASYLLSLLEHWPVADDRFILFTENPPRHDVFSGTPPVQLTWQEVSAPRGSRVNIWDWYALPNAVRKYSDMDLFWSPTNRAFPLRGMRQIVTVHDTLLQEKVTFSDPMERFYLCSITPFLLRKFVEQVITVSHFSAGRIHQVLGYSENQIAVIYNGASLPKQRYESPDEARRFLADQGIVKKRFIYSLGAESAWKNTKGILNAFRHVLKERPDSFLVVSGIQNRVRDRYERICRETEIEKAVTLLGFIANPVRDALYQGAEVFVYPSLFEGFGLPPLEAMAMGTPVVSSSAASIPEVTGQAAIMVDAANERALAGGILQMLASEEVRDQYRQRGQANIQRFDWYTSALHHRHLMQKVAKS